MTKEESPLKLKSCKSSKDSRIVRLAGIGGAIFLASCGNKTAFTATKPSVSESSAAPIKRAAPEEKKELQPSDSIKKEKGGDKLALPMVPKCKVDLKAIYGGFAVKGGSSLPFPETISEYPNAKLRLQFQPGTHLTYAESKLSASKEIASEVSENVSMSISDVPECDTKIVVKLLPDNSFVVGSALERGLKGKLYKVPTGQGSLPDFSTLKSFASDVFLSLVDVPTRSFTEGFPGVQELKEWFSIDFRGFLVISVAGDYQFQIESDDGSKLFLNNQLVIDNDGQHETRAVSSGVMHFNLGNVPLNLPYFQGPADQIALRLFYKGPGVSDWTIVPQSMLRVE